VTLLEVDAFQLRSTTWFALAWMTTLYAICEVPPWHLVTFTVKE
jgi:hypothetical protein